MADWSNLGAGLVKAGQSCCSGHSLAVGLLQGDMALSLRCTQAAGREEEFGMSISRV
jgi:hypothetical protein